MRGYRIQSSCIPKGDLSGPFDHNAHSLLPLASADKSRAEPQLTDTKVSRVSFVRSCRLDEFRQLLIRDPAEPADLDALELVSPEQVVDLVPADVKHAGDLLHCISLQ
jgi:hypothetical protein